MTTDIGAVTNFILFDFIPHLIIPFTFGILLIGMLTRFIRNGMNL